MSNNFLQNDFYFIKKSGIVSDGLLRSEIELNPGHKIYQGHFPEMPVVPGVCMIQMIKETLSNFFDKNLLLSKAESIKYHSLINPEKDRVLFIEIEFKEELNSIIAKSKIFFQERVFMKLSGTFNIIDRG